MSIMINLIYQLLLPILERSQSNDLVYCSEVILSIRESCYMWKSAVHLIHIDQASEQSIMKYKHILCLFGTQQTNNNYKTVSKALAFFRIVIIEKCSVGYKNAVWNGRC